MHISCTGNTGHGSRFIEKTAAEKIVSSIILNLNKIIKKKLILKYSQKQRVINKLLAYREEQKAK